MAYKTVLKSIGSTRSAGVGFLPITAKLDKPSSSYVSIDEELGKLRLLGVPNVFNFNVGDLINIRPDDSSPSIDTTVEFIGASSIRTTAPSIGIVPVSGVVSQRFYPPKKGEV